MAGRTGVVLWPLQVQADSPVGGKARALAELTRAGLPVPEWFVILPRAFDASLPPAGAGALAVAATAEAMQAAIEALTLEAEARREIDAACARLSGGNADFAVRSSALEEDSAAHSFAGQLESFLHVSREAVAARVADVWRSGFSERIVAYRRQAGLQALPNAPAVVVQRMVAGEVSGVAFSADPVSGRRGVAVVTGLPGLGSALVSGEATGDTWRVARDGQVLERTIAAKTLTHRPDPASHEGTRTVLLPPDEARAPCLDDHQVLQVAQLAWQAERHFGRPQDIEDSPADASISCKAAPSPAWKCAIRTDSARSGTTPISSKATAASPRRSPSRSRAAPMNTSIASSAA
jgi:pyruvate,water dikinase